MDPHAELQAWRRQTDSDIGTSEVTDDQIAALERRYGLSLPEDFRAYLRMASPANDTWDAVSSSWWPFDRIKNIPDECPKLDLGTRWQVSKYLFFADHAIWCWAWAISCAEDETRGNVVVVGGVNGHRVVARSFAEFVTAYIGDWASVS